MKGTVAPPSSNVTVASTCSARTPSSCAIFWLIFATRESLYQARDAGANHRQRDAAYGPTEVDSSRCGAQPSTEDFFVEPDAISPHSWVPAPCLCLDMRVR